MSKPSKSPFAGKPAAPVKASEAVKPPAAEPVQVAAPQRQPLNPVQLTQEEHAVLHEAEGMVANLPKARTRDGSRIPFGSAVSRFPELPPREGFHRRWFNDVRDRIARAQSAGYTHVLDEEGKNFTVPGGFYNGHSILIYAMELPMEFREEDIEAQQDKLDAIDQLIYRGKHNTNRDDKFYVPDSTPMNVRVQTGSGRG